MSDESLLKATCLHVCMSTIQYRGFFHKNFAWFCHIMLLFTKSFMHLWYVICNFVLFFVLCRTRQSSKSSVSLWGSTGVYSNCVILKKNRKIINKYYKFILQLYWLKRWSQYWKEKWPQISNVQLSQCGLLMSFDYMHGNHGN